ncbi:hypothetical protein BDW72DRAFT_195467 [Aspergillus terricola var. indicus]
MLDKLHSSRPQPKNDKNVFISGELHGYIVQIACLPSGAYGTWTASVATEMLNTFPAIRFKLLVGFDGGVPSNGTDVRLGDVVQQSDPGLQSSDDDQVSRTKRLPHQDSKYGFYSLLDIDTIILKTEVVASAILCARTGAILFIRPSYHPLWLDSIRKTGD